ncbi:hypothetical protein QN277_000207 [Acacia crassicarpa]|uniref:Uncharacterized protein n=1 Tax=Acacia crassicarpa TaxID=499986 RepID=A0AAE1TFA5_9FABA|nr:hypothetical protein QN277_000207 [Acacia crassicarpa]
MKTNALLAFFFFLVALFSSTRAEFVRDSEGHIVHSGGIYELVPQYFNYSAIVGTGTNLEGSSTWPVAVVENLAQDSAILIETKLVAAYITTDYPLHISFHPLASDRCTKHPEWLVVRGQAFKSGLVVVGEASHPVDGCFYFKSYDSCRYLYSLVFCYDQNKCGQVAVKTHDCCGHNHLIVAAEQESECPLVFKLVKQRDDHVPCDISKVVGSNLHIQGQSLESKSEEANNTEYNPVE